MRNKASPYRILIADDHTLVREEIRVMLTSEPDLEVVGDADNGEEALAMCQKLRPHLVLMDVSMPKMGGYEATRIIKERYSKTAVLIVTAHQGQDYLREGIRAGAVGYILKGAPKEQLVNAIKQTLDPELTL